MAARRETGNFEGLQFVSTDQSDSVREGQQLTSQNTDDPEDKSATCLAGDEQPVCKPATQYVITMPRKHAGSSSHTLNSEAYDVATSQSIKRSTNSSNGESTMAEVNTATDSMNSPAEDIASDRKERASTDMKQGSVLAKEGKENSPGSDPAETESNRSNSDRTISSTVGWRVDKKSSCKRSKVIVNINGTTYFMSRKRWRLLHKQWYTLIQY